MRQAKPFFRKQTKTWYVQIGKKQHNLGADEAEAKRKYHVLMIGHRPVNDETTVVELLVRFLEWNKQHRSAGTQELYGRHILPFAEHIGDALLLADLKPHHVTRWVDRQYVGGSANYRLMAIRSIERAMNWAVREGHIQHNPLGKIDKPAPRPRDSVLSAFEWARLVAALKKRDRPEGAAFLDLITLLRETGCRPQEARIIEARHVDKESRCLILDRGQSKGHSETRTAEVRGSPPS